MSNYDQRKSDSSEKITVAGIAAVIVVGVFVICVILILAKSLFPSNDSSVPDGIYTNTLSSAAEPPADDTSKDAEPTDESSQPQPETVSSYETSAADSVSSDTDSTAQGETAYLTQTAYLRSANDENSDPILSISSGEEVIVLERPADSEYVHVNYNGYDGWVWYGYLG